MDDALYDKLYGYWQDKNLVYFTENEIQCMSYQEAVNIADISQVEETLLNIWKFYYYDPDMLYVLARNYHTSGEVLHRIVMNGDVNIEICSYNPRLLKKTIEYMYRITNDNSLHYRLLLLDNFPKKILDEIVAASDGKSLSERVLYHRNLSDNSMRRIYSMGTRSSKRRILERSDCPQDVKFLDEMAQ